MPLDNTHSPDQVPHDEQPGALDSAGAATREVGWVAREAAVLVGSHDKQRRSRFLARKSALLDFIEAPTDEAAQTDQTQDREMG